MTNQPLLIRDIGHQRDESYGTSSTKHNNDDTLQTKHDNELQRARNQGLHLDPEELARSSVGKAVSGATDLIGEAVNGGNLSVMSMAKSFKKTIGNGLSSSGNLRDIVLGLIGGSFGLNIFKDILDAPKYIANQKYREKQSPLIVKGVKLLSGATIAYGLFKGILGGAGLSMPGLAVGAITFALSGFLSNIYESPESGVSKIVSSFGLRDRLIKALDFLKLESFLTGE